MRRSSRARTRSPKRKALSFFLSADRLDETHVWTYAELVADITRAANAFTALRRCARSSRRVCPAEPSRDPLRRSGEARLPERRSPSTRCSSAKQIADLLRVARASVLVTLAPALQPKAWPDLVAELGSLPDLKTIAFVDMADYLDAETREAARASIDKASRPRWPQGRQFARSHARTAFRSSVRRPRYPRLTTFRPTSAPAARPAHRRLRCGRIGTRFSTRGPRCKRWRPTARREPFSAACPCFT